tara:strand:+ start:466 stop:711 length:246 start_codon:yes stop_codon:yes gene_type:complete
MLAKHETPSTDPYNESLKTPIIIKAAQPILSGLYTIQKANDITPKRGAISSEPVGIIGDTETKLKIKVIKIGIILYKFNSI